jgi:N-acetylneuraminic acid mutarotase
MRWRLLFIIVFFTGLLTSCENYLTDPIADENWTQLKTFPGTARASATSFVVGDKAYVCFGRSDLKSGYLNDLWEFDSTDTTWTQKSKLPDTIRGRVKAIAGVIGTKVYIGLGSAGSAYSESALCKDFWEYDTETDTWTQKESFPGEAANDLFCTVIGGCIYTTLGYTTVGFNSDTYKYDPGTNSWTRLADCPIACACTAGFTMDSVFYVGTGFDGANHKDFYRYDTRTDNWKRVADLPDARILSNGVNINNKGYILLGRYWNGALNGGHLLSDIVEYDPVSDTWIKRGSCECGARQNAIVFSIGEKGYVVMGEDDSERKSDVWMFRP